MRRNGRMNWYHLFFAFHGRINRAQFWAGVLGLLALQLAVFWPMLALYETDLTAKPPALWFRNLTLLIDTLLAWPSLAVLAKRQADRDQGPQLSYLVIVVTVLYSALDAFGLLQTTVGYTPLGWVAGLISLGLLAVVIVELGMRPGTDGPNRFGPPPG